MTAEKIDLSTQDIASYFDDKNIQLVCPVCKAQSWQVLAENHGISTQIVSTSTIKPALNELQFLGTVALSCDKCGFIVEFRRDVIQAHLRSDDEQT